MLQLKNAAAYVVLHKHGSVRVAAPMLLRKTEKNMRRCEHGSISAVA